MCLYTFFICVPLIITFTILASSYSLNSLYNGPLLYLRNAFRRENEYNEEGFLMEYNNDITYYNRICTSEDISTRDANDLLLNFNQSSRDIADVMLEHGAVVVPNVLNDTTARALRGYLESRNELDESRMGLGWQEKFWGEMGRLALGLGRDDHPIIAQALHEVGSNELVEKMLEGIVGKDPALVEISTLTAKYGCDEQGIHTDSDYFGSSLLYSRTFLHSYTMFMALQDTTAKMGATTICPGTHMCANEDLELVCSSPNNIFEASSNGFTGRDAGVLKLGDAMMFNQNVWHRGPSNYDPLHPVNRVMFILTFVSRRQYELGDNRIQGLGTYYYYRWSQWGHTFKDLKYAITTLPSTWSSKIRFSLPWSIFKALGISHKIYTDDEDSHMGISWVEHFARQISNAEDFYADDELPEFRNYVTQYMPSWAARVILSDKTIWEEFVTETLNNIYYQLKIIYLISFGLYIFIHIVAYLLSGNLQIIYLIRQMIVAHIAIILLFTIIYQSIVNHSYLGKKIQSGQLLFQPFPASTSPKSPNTLLKDTTVPERMDVLFGTRFDTDYLESHKRMLDFHPGNCAFSKLVDESISTSSSSNDDLAVTFIYQSLHKPIKGVIPRMLLQDYATGYWTIMDETQSIRIIHETILEERRPLIRILSRHLKSILSDARFGPRRDLVMTNRFNVAFVHHWQRILFEEIKENESTFLMTGNSQESILWKVGSQLIKVPKSNDNKIIKATLHESYNIGDRVMAKYGDQGMYYEATIIDIIQEGQYYTIAFTEEEDLTYTAHYDSLQRYKPFSQGVLVEVEVDDNDWSLARVIEATPFGLYTIEYVKTKIRDSDISKESIRWPAEEDFSSSDDFYEEENEEDTD